MPTPLWQAAAAVARDHGLWFVSRALRVNYESLKRHVESLRGEDRSSSGFVESEIGMAPIERVLSAKGVGRDCPNSEALRQAVRAHATRKPFGSWSVMQWAPRLVPLGGDSRAEIMRSQRIIRTKIVK
jgi:hypothetical protein